MRACYKSIFHVGEAGRPTPALGDVATLCIDWARQRLPNGSDLAWDRDAEVEGDGLRLEVANASAQGSQLWGLRLSHADADNDAVRWATEVVLTSDGGLRFACKNSFGSVDGVMARTWRNPSRPRVVVDVLRKWGGHHALPLGVHATVLRDDEREVAKFAAMLTDPQRTRPVVVVSARTWDDKPVIDPHKLADWLAGLAHVWVAQNRFPSLKLKTHLPDELNCWDGNVRIYWPRFTKLAHSYDHKYWRADDVADFEQRRVNGFREYLLGHISSVAVFAQDPLERTWADLETARRRAAIEQSKQAGNVEDLERLIDEEMSSLEGQIKQLKEQLAARGEELLNVGGDRDYWKGQYLELAAKKAEPLSAPPSEEVFESVHAVIEAASSRYEERLVFALNGQSDENSEYGEPDEVRDALGFLATTYWECKTRGTHVEFDMELRQLCGWFYEGAQSEVTMTKYEPWYTTKWNGKKHWLANHIGKGTSKDPRRTIRIAFAWDPDEQKVVVGFVGQHQKTDAT